MAIMISYLLVTGVTTLLVGHNIYKNGIHFLYLLFDMHLAESLNKLLLTGYYLLNIGYIFYVASTWPLLDGWPEILAELAERSGLIFLLLGCIHFGNLGWLALLSRMKKANSQLFH